MERIRASKTFHQMESIQVEDDGIFYESSFVINSKKQPPRFVLMYIKNRKVHRVDLDPKQFRKLVLRLEKDNVTNH